tara:strand:+ start:1321 stop:1614 length:294 start_codon:yes stop_codon:yes gene_type:complete
MFRRKKKVKMVEYMPGGPKHDERMWEACNLSITMLYDEMKDIWAEAELRLMRKHYPKDAEPDRLKKMAAVVVAREYKKSKDDMIIEAYRKAVREKYD